MKAILVTGCGGNLGVSIARILRMELPEVQRVGTDIHANHPGPAFFDQCEILPPVRDIDAYLESLRQLIGRYGVDVIIPISEAELLFFGDSRRRLALGKCPVVMPNHKALSIGGDKCLTAEFLAAQGLPHPWTRRVGESAPADLPCVLKPRVGSGGKGFRIVDEASYQKADLAAYRDYIWQEYLDRADEEYTCGLFRSRGGEIRTLVFKRALAAGITASGEVISNPDISRLLEKIALGLDLVGSVNVQLRLTARGPVVFEINPRFSSTVVFRNLLGFKDVIWSVQDQLQMEIGDFQHPREGVKFFRVAEEVILQPEAFLYASAAIRRKG